MASYHFHSSCIQRSKGQNAVATAAYISASKLVYKTIDKETGEEISITYDFTKKQGVVYSKISVPKGFEYAAWLHNREQLWNAAEAREKREDSTIARCIEFALPKEVCKEENIKLVEEYAQQYIVARGLVCDVNIHYDNSNNPHVHFQFLERRLERLKNEEVVFAKRKDGELSRRKFLANLRHQCEVEINKVYEEAGLPFKVTAKSYKALGIDQEPTKHRGATHHMQGTKLEARNKEIIAENARKIRENPEIIFGRISYTKPVFTKKDIAIALSDALMVHLVSKDSDIAKQQEAIRAFGKGLVQEQVGDEDTAQSIKNNSLARAVNDQADSSTNNPAIEHLNKEYGEEFLRLYNQLLVSDKIELMDQKDLMGRTLYALKSRVNLEHRYVSAIEELNAKEEHNLNILGSTIGERNSLKEQIGDLVNVLGTHLQNKFNDKIGGSLGLNLNVFGSKNHKFSTEQINAILSVCNGSDISVLEGNPGAGKTFVMREIVRQYKGAGFKVVGTGPSSVSAKVLSRNAGIKADNTSLLRKKIVESKGGNFKIDLSSKYYEEEEYLKSIGCDAVFSGKVAEVLDSKSVLIVDEASMIELANMDYLAHEVLRSKAKLVLVGDNNQFTAVGMTGAFNKARKIAGGVKLTEVRRQERLEYREATEAIGRFAMIDAIEIYRKLDVFNIKDNEEEAKTSLISLFTKAYTEQIDSLKRDDLIAIRSIAIGAYTHEKVAEFNARVRGELKNSGALKGAEVQINSGGRMLPLMKGDQVVFEENSLRYGISNGEVGTILSVKPSVRTFNGSASSKGESDGDGILRVLVHKADGSKDIVNIDTAADAANNKRRIKLNHGYALTGYKLQGETVDRMHVYFDRSIGYEAFLVLMSCHRQDVKLHASAQELENIVYQRLDSDVEKVRKQFKINSYEMLLKTITNEDGSSYEKHVPKEIPNWLIGLTLAVSRRANNSFAIDYRSNGTLDGNQLIIKEYLEARSRVFECHGKMREWKSDIESPGNITRLYDKILTQASYLKSIKLDDTSPILSFELDLNIKDLKIDPYSIVLSDGEDSFKYVTENILKEVKEEQSESVRSHKQDSIEPKAIKGVTYIDGKVHINFKELDSKHQSKIIAICLKEKTYENLKEIFEELKLEKAVLRDYAGIICDSYSSVIDTENADEFKRLILEKRDASKLIAENKVEARALIREKNFSKSNERKARLEEQIATVKEQSAQYDEKLEEIASRISTRIALIQENTNLSSGSVLMGERTIQLNINYETLRKHAGYDTYKYYLKDISTHSSLNNCSSYQSLIELVRDVISNDRHAASALTNSKLMSLVNNYIAGIDNYNWDNKELLEFKRCDLLESQKALSDLKQEEQVTGNFVQTLFPHYLGRIYEQTGEEIIAKWEAVKAANSDVDVKALIESVKSNPLMLGKLPGIGIGAIFGVSSSRRKSIEQVSKLGVQLLKYEENMARLNEIENNDLIKEQEQKIVVLKEELNVLEALKASKAEEKFLSSLKTMQAGSGLNIKSFKSLIESDEVQDLLCEYYNNQNEKYTRINEPDRAVVEQEDVQSVTTNSKTNTLSNTSKGTSRRRERSSIKEPALRFDKVQDALTSSDIERIFRQYAASIRGGVGAIKRSGSEISMGSLSMNLSKGTWIRHSSGQGGNIFGFVQEGASVSKRQSLEIVAELAGIRAESSSYDYHAHLASSRANKEQAVEQAKQRLASGWLVAQDKINNADIFDPKKHLKGMMQHNILEAVYAYKDANDKLLGYVVRFVSKEDGKKQTLPVTYCYNAAKEEYSWRLKGFSDKGDKPIFGIEKAICSSKPILIVEGEKAAIAAAKILPDHEVVSWMGGSNAADKVNWGQLQWRDVIIWSDNDQPGFKAAEVIKDKLNKVNDHIAFVSVVDPTQLKFNGSVHKDLFPEKWDLADRLPEGMTIANVKEAIENVRAAHLDLNQIQSVIQNTNSPHVSQRLFERNIWQEVFKGKIIDAERIKSFSANEYKAASFFSSEESNNYVKYLEATGKGGVVHDYLKYDSLMYQDILTSLATHDERLSENIKELGNGNNAAGTDAIERKTKLIDDTQNLYEKKALECSGIAGTNAVYRDYLELMVKNYGESHEKVTLYRNIVRDVSILHSSQLGTNINDLPENYHKEMASTIYNNVTSYKAANGRGKSEHNIDNLDKTKISENCYHQLCSSNVWHDRALNSVKVADELLSSVNLSRQENVSILLEQEKHKIKDILKLNPKFDQEALKQTLAQVGAIEQEEVLNKVWLGEFKAQVLPKLDVLQKEKSESKTVNELIGVFKKEKEYCAVVHDNYFSLNFALRLQEDNNHISSVVSDYRYKPNLLDNLTRDINASQQYGIWNEERSLSYMKQCGSAYDSAQFMFQTCRDHVLKTIDNDLDTIKSKGVVEYDGQKYHDQIHYLEHRLNTNEGQTYVVDSKASITLARLKEEQSYEMNAGQQNNQNIAEKIEDAAPTFKIKL
ncbi:MobA/MobL family protein [Rickettsia tamurae]|uniref:DNA strand transferase n=1 Tax=Rickettsia tamurae subsp. buchneri TaxID=1462938 RepID=A0A8E0WKA5_9RICK|nr:MobA/MobL family protein [Rickettsia tamurae]KDO02208.1 DNA strand transferase [Rickettsia tamurae subsp. buchneri]